MVLGGAKVSDKIGVIANLLEKVNVIAIGGGMLFTFLAAQGKEIGTSLVEVDLIPTVKELLERAKANGVELLLPTDILVAPAFTADSPATLVSADAIPADQMGLDIGPESAKDFAKAIEKCKTVFWNGPMGVFEFAAFATIEHHFVTEMCGAKLGGHTLVKHAESIVIFVFPYPLLVYL